MCIVPRHHIKRRGLTITELVIVFAVVAGLIAVVIPTVLKLREAADRAECTCKLKQIGFACHNFESAHKRLPPLYGGGPQGENYSTVNSSLKFADVWGSTHVFLLPYLEMASLYRRMANGDPPQYVPPQDEDVPAYACPSDPSWTRGGTSYAANVQVFAPLANESHRGSTAGTMFPVTKHDFCDRGVPLSRLADGTTNIVMMIHSYARCGPNNQGSAWSYSAGIGNPPSPLNTLQPWSRASYLGQTYMTKPNAAPFQIQPNSYATECIITDPATPHANAMMVCLADASVRSLGPSILPDTWNRACLPNDGDDRFDNDW